MYPMRVDLDFYICKTLIDFFDIFKFEQSRFKIQRNYCVEVCYKDRFDLLFIQHMYIIRLKFIDLSV
jgi:hypothetical protein